MTKPVKHIFTVGQVVTNKQGQQAVIKQKDAVGYTLTALGGEYEYDFHTGCARDITAGKWRHKTVPVVYDRGFVGSGKYSASRGSRLKVVWRGIL